MPMVQVGQVLMVVGDRLVTVLVSVAEARRFALVLVRVVTVIMAMRVAMGDWRVRVGVTMGSGE